MRLYVIYGYYLDLKHQSVDVVSYCPSKYINNIPPRKAGAPQSIQRKGIPRAMADFNAWQILNQHKSLPGYFCLWEFLDFLQRAWRSGWTITEHLNRYGRIQKRKKNR